MGMAHASGRKADTRGSASSTHQLIIPARRQRIEDFTGTLQYGHYVGRSWEGSGEGRINANGMHMGTRSHRAHRYA